MKLKFTHVITGISFAVALLMQPVSVLASGEKNEDTKEKEKKEVKKAKVSSSRNNSSVRIYPDMLKRVMHVVAKDNEETPIDFFVFDLEGTIVKHFKMKSGAHEKLADLERGKYVFRVFSGDEETASGNFDIR